VPGRRDDLLSAGLISDAQLQSLEAEIQAIVEDAVQFAEHSPWPNPEEALEDVYV
jgi:TPP-dependent pyruvate/acetoin dehydrogenase alpha subunit